MKCKEDDIDTAINTEFDYITKYDKCVTPIYTDSAGIKILKQIKDEISEYGSIWVEYTIEDRTDKGIEQLVKNVLRQARNSVLEIIDKHLEEFEK